jgi:hypothetical protein
MTDVVPYRTSWVDLLQPAAELARLIGKTEFVPASMRDRGGAIAACVLYGAELGIGPMQALAKIAVVDGRPAPSAELVRGLALAAGHDIWLDAATTTSATMAGKRRNSDHVQRVTWTMDDARRAQLDGKTNWRRYPRHMLIARATVELVRLVAPDVLGGITLTAEELDDVDTAPLPPELEPAKPEKPTRKRSLRAVEIPSDTPDVPETTPQASHSDETPTEAVPTDKQSASALTANQRAMMHALFHELEVDDRGARLRLTSDIVGRKVASANDLTQAEVQILLDDLQRRKADGWIAF